MTRTIYDPEHEQFRDMVAEFLDREVAPYHRQWEQDGQVDRHVFQKAAKQGLIGFNVPEEYGGLGISDFRYNAVVAEELARSALSGPAFTLHNDIVAPYLLRMATDEQKRRWRYETATAGSSTARRPSSPTACSQTS